MEKRFLYLTSVVLLLCCGCLTADPTHAQTCQCDPELAHPPSTAEEQISAYECRQHVRKVANELRNLLEKLVRESVSGIFNKIRILRQLYPYVDALERIGLDCCQKGKSPSCCAEPLVEQLRLWNSEGLPEEINQE